MVGGVNASYSVLFDDDGASYWIKGTGVTTTETSLQYYGISCIRYNGTDYAGANYLYREFSTDGDWLLYDRINIYINIPLGDIIAIRIYAPDGSNYMHTTYTGVGTWSMFTKDFSAFEKVGNPDYSTITQLLLMNFIYNHYNYVDYMWLSSTDSQSLVVTDPIYATVTPTVGTHACVEGQPVQVSATMLLDYSFLKFSYSPVGVSTSNPMWLVMSENMTLNTIIVPPTDTSLTTIIAFIIIIILVLLSIIFYKLKLRLFCMLIAVIGITINVLSLSMNIPFTPYIQLLFMLIEMVTFIYSVNGIRK
jgi:hypothetical protein